MMIELGSQSAQEIIEKDKQARVRADIEQAILHLFSLIPDDDENKDPLLGEFMAECFAEELEHVYFNVFSKFLAKLFEWIDREANYMIPAKYTDALEFVNMMKALMQDKDIKD